MTHKPNLKCKLFGHKYVHVCINKKGQFKFVAAYCERCMFGHEELLGFIIKHKPIINSYDFCYWDK